MAFVELKPIERIKYPKQKVKQIRVVQGPYTTDFKLKAASDVDAYHQAKEFYELNSPVHEEVGHIHQPKVYVNGVLFPKRTVISQQFNMC